MFRDVLLNAGWDELFDPQPQAPFLGIDFEHLRLHRLANLQHVLRMLNAFLGAQIADVNHALDTLGKLNKGAKFSQADDWAFNHRSYGEPVCHGSPGISQRLLES